MEWRWGRGEAPTIRARVALASLVVGAVAAYVAVGCTEQRVDESLNVTTSAAPAAGATTPAEDPATSTSAAGNAFAHRLAAVDTSDLKLGAEFNKQFLSLQFLAVGLDATEATCAADKIAAASGDDFGTRAVNQVMSGTGITPDMLMPCVSTEHLMDLAKAGSADLSRVPSDVLRSTLTELASAGYESAGLTAVEATCLADHVVGTYSDGDMVDVMKSLSLPADRAVQALPACVTGARANELGG